VKAATLIEPGKVVIAEMPEPEPGPDEVLITVGGVGLCGSDLSVFSGKWKAPSYPWVMGHEAFGVVESVGSAVSPDRIGETVVVEPNFPCFACDQCNGGRTSACFRRLSVGMNRPGALAERLVVPARFAWPIHGVPETDLVCVEPTTVSISALRRLGEPLPNAALVLGTGSQGLVMSLALLDRGVEVYVEDVNAERADFAVELGAVSTGLDDAMRFHLVVDTVGTPSSVANAVDRVEAGGTLLFLGLDSRPLDLTSQTLVRRQLTLRGSLTYDHPVDFEEVTGLIAGGRLSPGKIVTDEYPLEDSQHAFERSGSARGKTWIRVASQT